MGVVQSANIKGLDIQQKFKEATGNDSKGKDDRDYSAVDEKQSDDYNEKGDTSLCYTTHETQVSEGGEADLHKYYSGCKKNPGHTQFVPVKDFNITHMPAAAKNINLVNYIKAVADLTVRVDVKMTSPERPEFWPDTTSPYSFYNCRGSTVMRLGTGMVWNVFKTTEKNSGACPCHKCQHSDTPSKVWGEVRMYTATHVVFDDIEARHTTCRLFYDVENGPFVSLGGWTMHEANINEDWCRLQCMTCDMDLLDKLDEMLKHREDLGRDVLLSYQNYREDFQLAVIVSHPHGCSKQISLGDLIDRAQVNGKTKYTYATSTCQGSSGARVHSLGKQDYFFYGLHVHSGVNSNGKNDSGIGWEYPLLSNTLA